MLPRDGGRVDIADAAPSDSFTAVGDGFASTQPKTGGTQLFVGALVSGTYGLIVAGVTGFLVDDLDGAVAAIARIGEIDRSACRAHVTTRFSVERMADDYLRLYRSILC